MSSYACPRRSAQAPAWPRPEPRSRTTTSTPGSRERRYDAVAGALTFVHNERTWTTTV